MVNKKDKIAIQKFKENIQNGVISSKILHEPRNIVDRVKKELCHAYLAIHKEYSVKQSDMAFLTGLQKSQISEIVNFHYDKFTIDFLMENLDVLIIKLKENSVDVKIKYLDKIGVE